MFETTKLRSGRLEPPKRRETIILTAEKGKKKSSEIQTKTHTQDPQAHFKVAKIDDEDHMGWRIASSQDIMARLAGKGQQLLGKNKELQCRIAFMGKVTIAKGRHELESEYLEELQYKLLTDLEPCLDIDKEFKKELAPLLFVDQQTTCAPDPDMSISQLVSSLLTEIKKWISLRKHTLAILNGIAGNLGDLDNREDIERAMGKSVPVAQGLALVGTSLLSILTGGAAAKYCSFVANEIKAQSDVSKSKVSNSQLKKYLTKYCCGNDLQSAVSVIRKDVEVSVYIQQLVSALTSQCSEINMDPVEELTTGALQYKKVFELIHGKEFVFEEDPSVSAKVLLKRLMQTSSVKNPVGLLLDTDLVNHLVEVACALAVGSTEATQLLLEKCIKTTETKMSMLKEKVSNLNNAYEREEFRMDLRNMFDRIKQAYYPGDKPTKEATSLIIDQFSKMVSLLKNFPSTLTLEGFAHFTERFLPTVVQNEERHKQEGKIEVVLIGHGSIKEPFIELKDHFPMTREDELVFYQPWGMILACDGAVAIATGNYLQTPNDRCFQRLSLDGTYFQSFEPEERCGISLPQRFNTFDKYSSRNCKLPTIKITPFRSLENEYREMCDNLARHFTNDPKLPVVCLWVAESEIRETTLDCITHLFQLYAHSLSSPERPIRLTIKYAGCLADDPILNVSQQNELHRQYFYSPVVNGKHDQMTSKSIPVMPMEID